MLHLSPSPRTDAPAPEHAGAPAGAAAPSHTVAVLVDGTPSSAEALRWAAAHVGDGRLRIITPYQRTYVPSEVGMLGGDVNEIVERGARREAAEVVRSVLGPDADVEHVVQSGAPRAVLAEHAADADLVVLGTDPVRGRRRLRRSPAVRIAGRLSLPVVLVPFDEDAEVLEPVTSRT